MDSLGLSDSVFKELLNEITKTHSVQFFIHSGGNFTVSVNRGRYSNAIGKGDSIEIALVSATINLPQEE